MTTRVLMVSPYSLTRPGGVQGQVLGLARALRRRGVDVRVLGPCDGPPPAPGVISVGPSVGWESNGSVAPIAAGSDAARRTLDAVRLLEPDIVHLHEPVVPGPALTLLLSYDGPMVGTFHASGDVTAGDTTKELALKGARPATARLACRVAVSAAARITAEASYGGEYEVLWNGIDGDAVRAAEPWPAREPAVMFCNRHEPRKGLGVLLDAWTGIDRRATLWIASQGPETEALRARRVPQVEWLGLVCDHERDRRLRAARAYCAPSLGGESFGIALLEPMAAGCPLVASDIDGYRNVARHADALLVPPGDAEALRHALRRVLDDDELAGRLSRAGVERAEHFSMHRLAGEYARVYGEVLHVPVSSTGR